MAKQSIDSEILPRERIRVVSLFNGLPMGGEASRILAFGKTYDKTKFDYRILSMIDPNHEELEQVGKVIPFFEQEGIRVDNFGLAYRVHARKGKGPIQRRIEDIRDATLMLYKTMSYMKKEKIDIIDARVSLSLPVGAFVGAILRIPVVATVYVNEWEQSWLRIIAGQSALTLCDAIISDSSAPIKLFQKWLWRRHPRAVVIPNSIPIPESQLSRSDARARIGIPTDKNIIVIGQIARVNELKGQYILLETVNKLCIEKPNLHVVICGHIVEADFREKLYRRRQELGLENQVHIFGEKGPIANVWAAIDIHAHPSLLDSSPIAIHESMSLGIPCVTTNVGGIPELVEDGVSGILIPPNDIAALEKQLRLLLENEKLRTKLGAGASQLFQKHHSGRQMAKQIEDLFTDIVNKRRTRKCK